MVNERGQLQQPGSTQLVELERGLWVHDGHKVFCGFRLHRCMTVVRLADGRLFVHSPNTLDPGLRSGLAELGEVSCVVAPNRFHSHAMDQFMAAYPSATFFGAPGLRERKPRLRIDFVLGDRPEPQWEGVLDQAHLRGNSFLEEVLFLHRASRTLVVTDLIENIHRENVGLGWRIGALLFGRWQRPWPSPEHVMFTIDAEAFERSLERVRSWEFDRIVLAHGRFIEARASEVFEGAVAEVLRRARSRGPLRRAACRTLARVADRLVR